MKNMMQKSELEAAYAGLTRKQQTCIEFNRSTKSGTVTYTSLSQVLFLISKIDLNWTCRKLRAVANSSKYWLMNAVNQASPVT